MRQIRLGTCTGALCVLWTAWQLAVVVPALAFETEQTVTAFVGGKIIPVEGDVIEQGTLLVTGQTINWLGPVGEADIPADANIVDVQGKVIMPGLICTHSHVGGIGGADSSGPIQPDIRIYDSINVRDSGFRRAVAGGLTTLNIMPGSGHLMSGQTVYVKLRRAETIDDLLIRDSDDWIMGGLKMANGTNPLQDTGGVFPGTRGKSASLQDLKLQH